VADAFLSDAARERAAMARRIGYYHRCFDAADAFFVGRRARARGYGASDWVLPSTL
jgi:hypothetical protein